MLKVAHLFGRTGFGDDPAAYANARPAYPQPLYQTLVTRCALGPGSKVFEVGPGTGAATAAIRDAGATIVHVIEPDARLAGYLHQTQCGPGITIDQTPFQHATLRADYFDLGIAATSFHWVRQRPGLRKAHAALKPGGWWAMWWTHFGSATDDAFQRATHHLFAALEPRDDNSTQRTPFDLDQAARLHDLTSAGLINARAEQWQMRERYDTSRLLALYHSLSVIRTLAPEPKAAFLDAIATIAERDFAGAVERCFTTTLYTAQRPPHQSTSDQPPATADARHP